MIRQLGPLIFFVTFTIGINNWLVLIEMSKLLYNKHYNKTNEINNNIPNIKKLIKNDPVTCARYYEHIMNAFWKLFQNTNIICGKVKDYFYVTEFQTTSLPHDHGLLWIKNAPGFGTFSNEAIEIFVDKYVTINQNRYLKHSNLST